MAAFAYGALVWFRQARSRFVLIGVALVGVVYFAAKTLGMRLTLLMFQAGIAVALVAVVVIFQEDLRRAFERIATGNPLSQRKVTPGAAQLIDMVIESVVSLAKRHIGALLVFRGKEPLDRHMTGGNRLDGEVCFPLLDSIFDTSSHGHDGAVVVDKGRILSFGVHLPLSTHVDKTKSVGTRHTAALGLSERSDALVLVVSEERGEISVAQDGALSVVNDTRLLRERLTNFLGSLSPETAESLWRRLFLRNLGAKALSVIIAVGTWAVLFGHQGETVARTYDVPISVHNVPDGFLLEQPEPLEANVTLSGPELAFQGLDASILMLSVDAGALHAGIQQVPIDAAALELPAGLVIHRLEPRAVTLRAQEAVTKEVAVRPRSKGRPPPRLKLAGLTSQPSRVALIIPKGRQAGISVVMTEPVDLTEVSETTTTQRRLRIPPGCRLVDPNHGTVDITVELTSPDAERNATP